jgi:hypothetical protein
LAEKSKKNKRSKENKKFSTETNKAILLSSIEVVFFEEIKGLHSNVKIPIKGNKTSVNKSICLTIIPI